MSCAAADCGAVRVLMMLFERFGHGEHSGAKHQKHHRRVLGAVGGCKQKVQIACRRLLTEGDLKVELVLLIRFGLLQHCWTEVLEAEWRR